MSKNLALRITIKEATTHKIYFQSGDGFRSIRLLVFLFSSFILLGTIAFIQTAKLELYDGLVILLVVPSLVIAFILLRPSDHRMQIDLDQNILTHETEYRFGLPVISKVDADVYAFSSFSEIKKEKNAYTDNYALILEAPGAIRIRLNFAQGKEPAKMVYRLLGLEEGPIKMAANELPGQQDIEGEEVEWTPLDTEMANMQGQLASWTRSLFFLGIVHFFASGVLDFTWGFILILVAIGSVMFRHPAMFVVHAFTLAFVGLSNILSAGLGFWALMGVYQIYLAYRTYKQFRQYQNAQARYFEEAEPDPTDLEPVERTERFFPWLSVIFSSLGLSTYCVVILVAFVTAFLNNGDAPMSDLLVNIFSLQFNLGLLGLAVGAAALLSSFPQKALSWVGLVMGVLWFILSLALSFIA